MGAESITVYFEPLGSVAGLNYYHETLVYTNSDGKQFLATAYAEGSDPTGSAISNLSQAAGAAESGTSSNYGNLVTEVVPVSEISSAEKEHWMGTTDEPYQQQTVETGDDLSSQWNAIAHAYSQIGSENLPYLPLTQNSNVLPQLGLQRRVSRYRTALEFLGASWLQHPPLIHEKLNQRLEGLGERWRQYLQLAGFSLTCL